MKLPSFRDIFSGDIGNRPRRRIAFTVILCLAVVAAGGVFAMYRTFRPAVSGPTEAAPIVVKTETNPSLDATPVVETVPQIPESVAPYKSENFRVGDIAIGGDMVLSASDTNPAPLAIAAVHGEAFTASGKGGSKLVITWETNKPARSDISYGKGVGQAEAVISETEFGTSHSVIIPDVAPASTYVYVIAARDKWGDSATSDPYAVYTGAKAVSLFELLAGAVGDVFGWAVKK
ncbi:MAG: hypothetical protein WCL23_02305 [Candidatus Moraniibacteriota bacterium]